MNFAGYDSQNGVRIWATNVTQRDSPKWARLALLFLLPLFALQYPLIFQQWRPLRHHLARGKRLAYSQRSTEVTQNRVWWAGRSAA